MKYLNNQFTKEELEILCQFYIDCQLSVLEEVELEYVLTHCHFASPIINETKDLIAISRKLKLKASKPYKSIWTWPLRVAACGTIALSAFTLFCHIYFKINDDNCIVYVEGKRTSGEEALKIAKDDVVRMQKFILTVNDQQAHEKAKVEQFMNQINQSK